VKEAILLAKKGNKFVRASDLNFQDSNNNIYVNEHLTASNKNLFWLARNTKQLGYKYCWTKGGKIFIRKDEESRVIRVTKTSDIPNEQ
jgi:putative hemolysin